MGVPTSHLTDPFTKVMMDFFITRTLGTQVGTNDVWPVYRVNIPNDPDKTITLHETAPVSQGRDLVGGAHYERKGLQVQVRSNNSDNGEAKARAIVKDLTETITTSLPMVYQASTSEYYRIHSFSKTSGPIALGKELEASKRYLFTINFTVAIDWLDGYTP